MKSCSRCGSSKDDACFYKSRTLPMGLRSACKACERGRERNLAKDRANNAKWFSENKTKRRNSTRTKKYGVSPESIEFTFNSQGRRCAICETEEPGGRFNVWNVDHDHATKRFRGVVCYRCNQLLGYARDSIEILTEAISYLRGGKNVVICEQSSADGSVGEKS